MHTRTHATRACNKAGASIRVYGEKRLLPLDCVQSLLVNALMLKETAERDA